MPGNQVWCAAAFRTGFELGRVWSNTVRRWLTRHPRQAEAGNERVRSVTRCGAWRARGLLLSAAPRRPRGTDGSVLSLWWLRRIVVPKQNDDGRQCPRRRPMAVVWQPCPGTRPPFANLPLLLAVGGFRRSMLLPGRNFSYFHSAPPIPFVPDLSWLYFQRSKPGRSLAPCDATRAANTHPIDYSRVPHGRPIAEQPASASPAAGPGTSGLGTSGGGRGALSGPRAVALFALGTAPWNPSRLCCPRRRS